MALPVHPRNSYKTGIICALDVEKAAVEATLDEEHGRPTQLARDDNVYSFGKIGVHDVVIACLSAGVTGTVSATTVASHMMHSFPIKAGLMVGVGGGVWSEETDVRLGDVVVSEPNGQHGGVVQWDFGKMEKKGAFRRTSTLDKPRRPLLQAVQSLKATHRRKGSQLSKYLEEMLSKYPQMEQEFGHPGREHDELFEAGCNHSGGNSCKNCDRTRLVERLPERKDDKPKIHYGNIASGNGLMKDGLKRDRIARKEEVLCFEMESAGLMDTFPCVVIRGISDYADSHKNKRWQPYAAATAACYAKELLSVVNRQVVDELGVASNAKYHIPFSLQGIPAIDYFVERPEATEQLTAFFTMPAGRKIFVVHGLGGMGKTQLCVDFVRKHHERFSAILWLNGSSRDAIRQSLAQAALMIPAEHGLSHKNSQQAEGETQELIDKLLEWLFLADNTNWLLVLDNVDRDWQAVPKDLQAYNFKDFLPPVDHGNVLVTTRLSRMQIPKASLHLRGVNEKLGRDILEAQVRKKVAGAGVEKLLEELGGLPLALVQAGSYLRETNMSVDEYLQFYKETWATLMNNQSQFPAQEHAERSVLTTWKMSYDQVRSIDPQASKILDQWAFLSASDIWYQLAAQSPVLSNIAKDQLSFRHSLSVLSNYSLVTADVEGGFSIHPVVHCWCLYNIPSAEATQLLYICAIGMVNKMIPFSRDAEDLAIARRLINHAREVASINVTPKFDEGLLGDFREIAGFLTDRDSLHEAEGMYRQALKGSEKTLGAERELTLDLISELGNLYVEQGKLQQAEEMLQQALAKKEKALGSEHASTLEALQDLGYVYAQQGKLMPAEKMYLQALQGSEKDTAADHALTFDIIGHLGILYSQQGNLERAEKMFELQLESKEKVVGVSDVDTLTLSVEHNLGIIYAQQGKHKLAEETLQLALEEREKAVGAEHTSTLHIVNDLGIVYYDQSKIGPAEQMYSRALAGYKALPYPDLARIRKLEQRLLDIQRHRDKTPDSSARTIAESSTLPKTRLDSVQNSSPNDQNNPGLQDSGRKTRKRKR